MKRNGGGTDSERVVVKPRKNNDSIQQVDSVVQVDPSQQAQAMIIANIGNNNGVITNIDEGIMSHKDKESAKEYPICTGHVKTQINLFQRSPTSVKQYSVSVFSQHAQIPSVQENMLGLILSHVSFKQQVPPASFQLSQPLSNQQKHVIHESLDFKANQIPESVHEDNSLLPVTFSATKIPYELQAILQFKQPSINVVSSQKGNNVKNTSVHKQLRRTQVGKNSDSMISGVGNNSNSATTSNDQKEKGE
ncbi:unnamed protein product [Vicia faba]|uniref:Uncharacterized protein n=1 Tax=Vicia faba TaxID=3906 RepID=A0AAV1AQ56_VICFA|nr:unnamed protein product [Vicia faba]